MWTSSVLATMVATARLGRDICNHDQIIRAVARTSS